MRPRTHKPSLRNLVTLVLLTASAWGCHGADGESVGSPSIAPVGSAAGGSAVDGSAAGGSSADGSAAGSTTRLFPAENPWNRDVSALPVQATSSQTIDYLASAGGWGGGRLLINFSLNVLEAAADTPFLQFQPSSDFYTPDCDNVPFPVPDNGALEGEAGYQCTQGGDCHLLVVHPQSQKLYEMIMPADWCVILLFAVLYTR